MNGCAGARTRLCRRGSFLSSRHAFFLRVQTDPLQTYLTDFAILDSCTSRAEHGLAGPSSRALASSRVQPTAAGQTGVHMRVQSDSIDAVRMPGQRKRRGGPRVYVRLRACAGVCLGV